MDDNKIKVGALWNNTAASGTEYMSGKFGDAKLLVFANGYKEKPNQPDWIVYIAPPRDRSTNDDADPFADGSTSWPTEDDEIPW